MEPSGSSLVPASVVTLPGSIMPSDVPSLVGSSFPTTLVMDTESPTSLLSSTSTAMAATIIYTTPSVSTSIGAASSADATAPSQGPSDVPDAAGSATGGAAGGAVSATPTARAPRDKVSIGVLGLCLVAGVAART